MMRHAFETLGCVRVEFKTDARNERSRAALAALPAKFEGILRNHMIVPDVGQRDSAYYSVIDSEWPEVRANLERRLARGDRRPIFTEQTRSASLRVQTTAVARTDANVERSTPCTKQMTNTWLAIAMWAHGPTLCSRPWRHRLDRNQSLGDYHDLRSASAWRSLPLAKQRRTRTVEARNATTSSMADRSARHRAGSSEPRAAK